MFLNCANFSQRYNGDDRLVRQYRLWLEHIWFMCVIVPARLGNAKVNPSVSNPFISDWSRWACAPGFYWEWGRYTRDRSALGWGSKLLTIKVLYLLFHKWAPSNDCNLLSLKDLKNPPDHTYRQNQKQANYLILMQFNKFKVQDFQNHSYINLYWNIKK